MDLAVIKNLTPETAPPHVLYNVARWHNTFRGRRHAAIAQALFAACAEADRTAERMREAA